MTNPFATGPLVREIEASLRDEPEKWEFHELHMITNDGNVLYWDLTGAAWDGETVIFNFIERYRLRRAVRNWKRRST